MPSNYELAERALDNAVQETVFGPAELLGGKPVKQLVRRFNKRFDRFGEGIIDSLRPGRKRHTGTRGVQRRRFNLDDVPEFMDHEDVPPQPQRRNMPYGRRSAHGRAFIKRRRVQARGRGRMTARSSNPLTSLAYSRPGPTRVRKTSYAEIKWVAAFYAKRIASPTTLLLSAGLGPPQGPAFNERIGDQIKVQSIQLNYQVVANADMPATAGFTWRLTIFQWHSNNTTPPVQGDILNIVAGSPPAFKFFNTTRKALFSVLLDVSGTVNGDGSVTASGNTVTGLMKTTLFPKRSILDFNKGLDTGMNQLYFIFDASDTYSAAPSVEYPKININTRVNFSDS